MGIDKSPTETYLWELGLMTRSFLSGNICCKFLVYCRQTLPTPKIYAYELNVIKMLINTNQRCYYFQDQNSLSMVGITTGSQETKITSLTIRWVLCTIKPPHCVDEFYVRFNLTLWHRVLCTLQPPHCVTEFYVRFNLTLCHRVLCTIQLLHCVPKFYEASASNHLGTLHLASLFFLKISHA